MAKVHIQPAIRKAVKFTLICIFPAESANNNNDNNNSNKQYFYLFIFNFTLKKEPNMHN